MNLNGLIVNYFNWSIDDNIWQSFSLKWHIKWIFLDHFYAGCVDQLNWSVDLKRNVKEKEYTFRIPFNNNWW